ncbi:hypothetical protein MI353_21170 [Alteromonas sp. MCA-1]|uniref:hypothetical protein n=1 Tax=Alteromonas sp. MCA-1 TaxID=2917731 RepID=UPI001EF8B8E3|nr:hypothetical protein [Alteromonas sp. MCA-1]
MLTINRMLASLVFKKTKGTGSASNKALKSTPFGRSDAFTRGGFAIMPHATAPLSLMLDSPNKSMRAVVINADCGATTNWQTQVYVEKVDGSRKTSNLIRLDGHPKDTNYKISWLNDDEFLISEFQFDKMLGFQNQSWGTDFVRVHFKVQGS